MCLVERKIVMMSFISQRCKTVHTMLYIKSLKDIATSNNIQSLYDSNFTWCMVICILSVSQSYTLYFLLIKKTAW